MEERNLLLCIINTNAVSLRAVMEGVIYCYHCIPTGKKYIGQTDNEKRRKYEHLSYYNKKTRENKFYRAVRKYGWENFIYGIIENVNIEDLDYKEIFFIEFYDTYNNGYNSSLGGKTTRGYKHTNETKKLLREMKLGSKHSNETKQKMSKDRKGRIPWNVGIPLTEEVKQKISKKLSGENHPLYRKGHTDEAKLKMKLSFTEERKERLRQFNKNKKRKYYNFKITFIDGKEIFVDSGINKWCKENGYNLGELYKLKRGEKKLNRYRDIVKIENVEK